MKCVKCGKEHGMGVENMETGEFTRIDVCRDCLFEGCYVAEVREQVKMEEITNFIGRGNYDRSLTVKTLVHRCYECKQEKRVLRFDCSDDEYTELRFCIDCLVKFNDGFVSDSTWEVDYSDE